MAVDAEPSMEGAETSLDAVSTGSVEDKQSAGPLKSRLQIRLLLGLMTLAVVYTLAIAQSFLIPVALGFLVSLVLAPVVRQLERLHIPRTIGAGMVVLLLLSLLSYGIASSIDPISDWVERAPSLLKKLERKVYPIKRTVQEVSKTAEQVDRITSVSANKTVQVKGVGFREVLYANAQGLVSGAVMATMLLYFFLSWGRVVLMRIGRLLGDMPSRHRFLELTMVLEGEVSKYLLMITLINFGLGIVVAATLYAFGMPNPLLWGVVAALFNYIPYVGSLASAVLIGATALLNFDGLAMPLLIVMSFIGITVLEGQIVTPLVLGRRLALNPLIVFLSVVFWFWLWGVVGAFMAVPMLITLKLIADRVEALHPIAVIAGR